MKTNRFFGLAALACGFALTFTACSKDDNPISDPDAPKTVTISFEGATLNTDGFWCGDENGTKFDNWGADAYACNYQEAGVDFAVNYTPAWGSWSGFAISNRTATTYKDMTPDQFNNIAGTAKSMGIVVKD